MYYQAFIASPQSPSTPEEKQQLQDSFRDFLNTCRQGVLRYSKETQNPAVVDVLIEAFNKFVGLTNVDVERLVPLAKPDGTTA